MFVLNGNNLYYYIPILLYRRFSHMTLYNIFNQVESPAAVANLFDNIAYAKGEHSMQLYVHEQDL